MPGYLVENPMSFLATCLPNHLRTLGSGALLLGAVLSCPGCAGFDVVTEWGPGHADFVAPLPGGYFVYRTSAHRIIIAPDSWHESTPIIPAKVVELDHDDAFVIARQQRLRPRGPGDSYEEPVPGAFSYWILNVRTPQVWGPLSEDEFRGKRSQLGVAPALKLRDVYDYRPAT